MASVDNPKPKPTRSPLVAPAMRLTLTRQEAAGALGVSVDFFDDHIALDLRCIRRGRCRLYPVVELKRWVQESAARVGS